MSINNSSNITDNNRNNIVYLSPREVDYKKIKDLNSEESYKLDNTINVLCYMIASSQRI